MYQKASKRRVAGGRRTEFNIFEGGGHNLQSFRGPSTVRWGKSPAVRLGYPTDGRTVRRTLPRTDCERSARALELGNIVEGDASDAAPRQRPANDPLLELPWSFRGASVRPNRPSHTGGATVSAVLLLIHD